MKNKSIYSIKILFLCFTGINHALKYCFMKKSAFVFALILILLSSCTNNESEYPTLIQGLWVNTEVNHQPVLTDETFAMEFKSDGSQMFARGFQLDSLNKTWMENENYTYEMAENTLTIDGTDALDMEFHLVFEIITLNQTTLIYSVKTFTNNGLSYPDSKIYTCKRVTNDFKTSFEGIWYGHCISVGTTDLKYHYWKYLNDGNYTYYYQDSNDVWISKTDNEGQYFLYGNLFVSNYSNDLISGGTGKAYECWSFDIEADTMVWNGLRVDNKTVTYEMERVVNTPL
jgi:hypothetical protein